MILHQETTGHWPAKHLYPEFALASATDQRDLLPGACMMAQDGEVTDGKEPVCGSPQPSQQHGALSRRSDAPQATVLIIDDEEPVRQALVEVLSFHGYRVITAASVGDAEEAKQQLGAERIDLVIADVHLTPGRQVRAGYALAQRWSAGRPRLPIILISGDSANQDLPDVRSGAIRFLLKPFQMKIYLEAVREALGR
jgi:CheY-like chemotaxis protein